MSKETKIIPCKYNIKMMDDHEDEHEDEEDMNEMKKECKFSGYASLFDKEPDSYGDIIEKGAFAKSIMSGGRNKNGIAMLSQHDATKPIGVWTKMEEDNIGLRVEGKLAVCCSDGKDMYELMKIGAIKGLSIGYSVKKEMWDQETKTRTLMEVDLWEISPVTFPAKIGAMISNVKSVEDASNERDLENALRESGLSKSAALYIVKMCKDKLRESVKSIEQNHKNKNVEEILKTLKEINTNLV